MLSVGGRLEFPIGTYDIKVYVTPSYRKFLLPEALLNGYVSLHDSPSKLVLVRYGIIAVDETHFVSLQFGILCAISTKAINVTRECGVIGSNERISLGCWSTMPYILGFKSVPSSL